MSFVSLFTDEKSWLATDKRVFRLEEQTELAGAVEQMQHLSELKQTLSDDFKSRVVSAEEKGFEEGYAAGLKRAQQDSIAHFEELHGRYQQLQASTQSAVSDLALSAVRKIAGNVAPEQWLAAQAREAVLALAPSDQPVRLRVSVVHADKIRERLRELDRSDDALLRTSIEVISDEQAKEGTCTLETQFGLIDIDLETQLDALAEVLSGGSDAASIQPNGYPTA